MLAAGDPTSLILTALAVSAARFGEKDPHLQLGSNGKVSSLDFFILVLLKVLLSGRLSFSCSLGNAVVRVIIILLLLYENMKSAMNMMRLLSSVQADCVITMAQIGKNSFGFFQSGLFGII